MISHSRQTLSFHHPSSLSNLSLCNHPIFALFGKPELLLVKRSDQYEAILPIMLDASFPTIHNRVTHLYHASYCLLATKKNVFSCPLFHNPHPSSRPLKIINTDHCKSGPRYHLPVRPLIIVNQQKKKNLLLLTPTERKRKVMKKAISRKNRVGSMSEGKQKINAQNGYLENAIQKLQYKSACVFS